MNYDSQSESASAVAAKWAAGTPTFSVEFFPAKEEKDARQLLRAANAIKDLPIDFASITYGAGGSSRERTLDYGELIADIFGFRIMPHLTLVGHSRAELLAVLERYRRAGFFSVMALRGDPPRGETNFVPAPDGLAHASELVALIRENFGGAFMVGVAGYPEKHPEAPDAETDLRFLKEKVERGANFVTTQMFFDNEKYFSFVESARAIGIRVPIVPGIMPVLSLRQLDRVNALSRAHVPAELREALRAADEAGDAAAGARAGLDWAEKQIRALVAAGAPGVHLYIMNRGSFARDLCSRLGDLAALRA